MPEYVRHENLIEAMRAVMDECSYVQKRTKVDGTDEYLVASEADVIATLRPAMVKHGVVGPLPGEISRLDVTPIDDGCTHCVIVREFCFAHTDSEYTIVVTSAGEAIDGSDKAVPKALTCCYKYALRQAFCLESGTDPDHVRSERGHQHEVEYRRVANAIEAAKDACGVAKVLDGLDRIAAMFSEDQVAKLRTAAKNKLASIPGQPIKPPK